MNISDELIIAAIGFCGTLIAVVWRFSRMQAAQDAKIAENEKELAKVDTRTSQCEVHQVAVASYGKRVEDVESKISKQSGFNIQTEKQVTQLVTEFAFFKDDVIEMKGDIKTLLKMRLEE